MAGDNKTTLETDVEIKVKSDELKKLEKEFKNLNKEITTSNEKITSLSTALEKLKGKQQFMTKNAYSAEYNKLSSSLGNEKAKLKENKDLSALYKDEIKKLKEEISALEGSVKAKKENVEATKKNTQAKKKETKTIEDAAKAEEKKAKEAEKSARLERDSQSKRMNAESARIRAQAALLAAQAKQDAVDKRYEFQSRKRTGKYQAGRGLYSAGSYLGRNISAPMGNILGTGAQLAGAALMNPAMGFSVAIGQATKAVTQFAKASIDAYGEIESIKTQLGVVFGSQTQSDAMFQQLSEYAVKSPFGVKETAELATLLKQSGVYASDLMDTLKMLGDTAGGNMEKMKRIANNYAQIVSIGKASMLDMRQFAYAGIPIFEKVSEELGVSQQRLRKLISDGKVTADVIERVFKNMTGENGIFENATQKGAETFKARLQNLKDAKQLTLAEMGQTFMNVGSTGMNDGYIKNGMTFVENMYNKLKEWSAIINIEKSVKNIEERDSEISQLRELIEYNESIGNKKEAERLRKQLTALVKKIDPEKDRATLANAYDERKRDEYLYSKYLTGNTEADIKNMNRKRGLMALATAVSGAETFALKGMSGAVSSLNWLTTREFKDNSYWGIWAEKNEENMKNFWHDFWFYGDAKRAAENGWGITDKMAQANAERYTEVSQQTMGDYIKTAQDKENSIYKSAQEIIENYEKTDEYQQEQQEKTTERWKATIELLKEISSHTADDGKTLEYRNLSRQDFLKYLNSGALEGRKLATTGDNPMLLTQDSQKLRNSIRWSVNNLREDKQGLSIYGEDIAQFEKKLTDFENLIIAPLTDDEFIKNFNTLYENFGKGIDSYESSALSRGGNNKDVKAFFNEMKQIFSSMTMEYLVDTTAKDVDLDAIIKKMLNSNKTEQPLWKRIIASATGLSANVIKDSTSALTAYSNDLAKRNIANNAWGAMLGNGANISSILKQTRVGGNLVEDGKVIKQIDWVATGKAIKEFTMQLSASTDVISAYNKGLEDEINTYSTLLTTAITQAEYSEGNNKQRYVADKTLQFYMDEYGQQLKNVFGSGAIANGKEIAFDEKGNAIYKETKELVDTDSIITLTDTFFDELEKKLKERRSELTETYTQAFVNGVYGGLTSTLADTKVMSAILGGTGGRNFAYLDEKAQSDYLSTLYKNLNLNGNGGFNSTEDLLAEYVKGNVQAKEAIDKEVDSLGKATSSLAEFRTLIDQINENTLRENANKVATSIMGQGLYNPVNAYDKKTFSGQWYRLFSQPVLNNLGYGDIRFEDVASMANQNNATIRNKVATLGAGISRSGQGADTGYLKGELKALGIDDKYISQIDEANGLYQKQLEILRKIADAYGDISDKTVKQSLAQAEYTQTLEAFGDNVISIGYETTKDTWLKGFETMGQNLIDSENASQNLEDNMRSIGSALLNQLGTEMATAGFRIAGAAAMEQNWAGVIAGLGLAAAGGVSSGLGSAVAKSNKNKSDDESAKLQSLADQIKELLAQARSDALYYENNMRHQEALGKNKEYSYRSVHDALIDTNGQIITTDPKDYLIATKNPRELVSGGNVNVQPQIHFTVQNNAGVQVRQEQRVNSDGSIEVLAILEQAMDNYIASGRSDEAFSMRAMRLQGNSAVR